jgi:putative NADPH-quinone reductase
MTLNARRIVVIQGHADPGASHFCHALAKSYVQGAAHAGHHIDTIDVACVGFPLLRSWQDQRGEAPPAIAQAESGIASADHVTMIFPLWNGGAPPLLRGFLEQTFRPAFTFPETKPNEVLGFFSHYTQKKALKGKTARVVVTMQMPAYVYRWYLRPHPEVNTLRLSGMDPITETLIGNVESPRRVDSANDGLKRWLRSAETGDSVSRVQLGTGLFLLAHFALAMLVFFGIRYGVLFADKVNRDFASALSVFCAQCAHARTVPVPEWAGRRLAGHQWVDVRRRDVRRCIRPARVPTQPNFNERTSPWTKTANAFWHSNTWPSSKPSMATSQPMFW